MHTSFIEKAAQQIAEKNAGSWEPWQGDCHCGKIDALGFCDRCTDCAIQSIYENEREYGGSTESAMSWLMVDDCDKYARTLDRIVPLALEIQATIWRDATKQNRGGK